MCGDFLFFSRNTIIFIININTGYVSEYDF